jgi:Ca2+-dependent lipid-binding protein
MSGHSHVAASVCSRLLVLSALGPSAPNNKTTPKKRRDKKTQKQNQAVSLPSIFAVAKAKMKALQDRDEWNAATELDEEELPQLQAQTPPPPPSKKHSSVGPSEFNSIIDQGRAYLGSTCVFSKHHSAVCLRSLRSRRASRLHSRLQG